MEDAAHGYVSGSNHTETAGEVRNGSAGSELFPQDMDGNRQLAALAVLVCIPHQLNKAKGQEQACQKIKGAVLVAGNEEVGAPLLAGQFQVNLIPGGDLLDQLRLEHLQPGAKADDDAAAHCVAGLLEQAVGRFGRMGGRQNIKQTSKSLYRGLGSIDIAAIARSVLMISRDESRPDIRYMYPIKSSLAPEGPAIAFSFKEHGGIVWHGKYDLNTAELMDSITVKTTKRERARAKLVQLLEHEDRPAKEVYAGLADIGVGSRTVEKAKKELQVTTYRSGGSWYWSLPKPK